VKTKLLFAIAAAGLWACAPSVEQTPSPSSVTIAVFDPTTSSIPLPNDLALSATAGLPAASKDLLNTFAAQGGFPNDQEVAITISFQTQLIGADGKVTTTAPDLDLTSFNQGTLLVLLQQPSGFGTVALDPIQATDYVKGPTSGTLTLHNKGRQPWAPGEYLVALRGGPNGIKTAGGQPIYASQTFYFIAQGQHLDTEANIGLLRAQAGSTAAAQALAQQLDTVIDLYTHNGVYAAVNQAFPQQELAVLTTFAIAPLKTTVELDPGRGLVPLPIDLLRDPRPVSASCASCGKITVQAACTFASGHYNAANNTCDTAAAGGFEALDGFSTTAMIIAPVGGADANLQAATVNTNTVLLYDLTDPAHPALVDQTTYITEPAEVQQSGLSPVIALQPAGATGNDPSSVFRTRPLKDNTMYAVVISDLVVDQSGNPLGKGTTAAVLQFPDQLVDASGNSQLTGIDNNTAGALEVMRQTLVPTLAAAKTVFAASIAAHKNVSTKSTGSIAMAYTFKTQTILGTAYLKDPSQPKGALEIAALPYTQPAATAVPAVPTSLSATAAFVKYGVDPAVVPHDSIGSVLETTITTFNLLDPTTGAFNASGTTANENINVLISLPAPTNTNIPACAGPLAPFGKCAPMVIFRHGLGGGRANMLEVANTFNAQGMAVVAIDAAKHGDRSFCQPSGPAAQCPLVANGAPADFVCVGLAPGAQGDASPPGCCVLGSGNHALPASFPTSCGTTPVFQYQPVSKTCAAPGSCGGYAYTEGIPAVSAQYLVSSNFFRTRDTLRQDLIDQSQLVRAVAFVPSGPPPTGHNLFDYIITNNGFIIDPGNVSFVGQSLGSIQGPMDVATNPRIGKAVLNVGGATVVDIFANSPAFVTTTDQLLATLGIVPGANSAYLQFLVVAKTILDPADPVNYAEHITANTLPDLLAPSVPAQPDGTMFPKSVLTQVAFCDQTVPNPFEYILDTNILCGATDIGACTKGPLPYMQNFGAPGNFELFYKGTSAPTASQLSACPAPPTPGGSTPGAVTHAFITDWSDATITGAAQGDAAAFLGAGTLPNSLKVLP
jgi:hypothetical protein